MKSCPFCGSTGAGIVPTRTVAGVCRANGYAMACDQCCAQFPGSMTIEDAVASWERRAAVEITDELVERAVESWLAPRGYRPQPHARMRAALAAALSEK